MKTQCSRKKYTDKKRFKRNTHIEGIKLTLNFNLYRKKYLPYNNILRFICCVGFSVCVFYLVIVNEIKLHKITCIYYFKYNNSALVSALILSFQL